MFKRIHIYIYLYIYINYVQSCESVTPLAVSPPGLHKKISNMAPEKKHMTNLAKRPPVGYLTTPCRSSKLRLDLSVSVLNFNGTVPFPHQPLVIFLASIR
jgi:hypothetical protein